MSRRFGAGAMASAMAVLVCAIITAADLGLPLPLRRILAVPLMDKLGHLLLFGSLSWVVVRAAILALPSRPRLLVGAVCTLLLVALASIEEWSQNFIEARTFSLWDLLASCLGILAMSALQVGFSSGHRSPGPRLATGKRA